MIEFASVGFTYPGSSDPALADVTFGLGPGEFVAVLGANGSGKSTLARLCDGLLLPGGGVVTVDGIDTADQARVMDVRERVAMVFQNPDNQIVGTTVEEDVAFGPENLGLARSEIRERVDESLAAVGLGGMEEREPHLLSGGQKQRLAIAGALAMRPRYVVLDEPTAMLDPEGRSAVLTAVEVLRSGGCGVLHVTHDMQDAASADRVIVLSQGRVEYLGPAEGILGDAEAMARCGLEPSPLGRLAAALRERGLAVPALALDAESVVAAL